MADDADFGTTAALDIVVREQQLQQVREQIEDRLQGVEVGVEDGGGGGRPPEMRPDGGGRGLSPSRERRFARREHRWARQRTSDVSDLLTAVRNLDGEGAGGGILSGLLDEVIGTAGEGAGAAALTGAAGALTASAKALTGAALALGGSEVLDLITGNDNIKLDDETREQLKEMEEEGIALDIPDDGVPLDIPENGIPIRRKPVGKPPVIPLPDPPKWITNPPSIPIDIPPVFEGNEVVINVNINDPSPLTVDAPESIPVETPGPLPVESPGPLPLDIPKGGIPVDAPTSIPVTGPGLGFGGITQIANGDGGGNGEQPPDLMGPSTPGGVRIAPGASGGGPVTNPFVEQFGQAGLITEPAFRYAMGVRRLAQGVAGGGGGGESSGPTGDPFFLPPENAGSSQDPPSGGAINQTIDIDQEASAEIGRIDVTVEAAFDELEREIKRELVSKIESVERDLKQDIGDLRDEIKR